METAMARKLLTGIILLFAATAFLLVSCDKERIVESSERVHDTEYVQLPPDTILLTDTVFINDSVSVHSVDTVTVHSTDTVYQTNYVHDTVNQISYVYDTVVTVQNHYDTTHIVDTVLTTQCNPNALLAVSALQFYTDPLVLDFINQEFQINDGWVFYLSTFQLDVTQQSSSVYDFYGFIDYWTPDWSAYYPLEFFYRMTFTGGDPADPNNWQISEPPAAASGHMPGVILVPQSSRALSLRK